jgi:CRISPR-associated protein Csx10
MKALTFNIHLLEPLLVNDISGGDPNSAVGFEFIPGSVIRGALIGKYLQGKPKSSIDAEDAEFRELFFDGAVRFLNAYSSTKNYSRSLPTPFSWHVEKGDLDNIIYDFSTEDHSDNEEKYPEKNWKKVSEPFCHLFENDEGEGIILYQPSSQVKIHIFRANRQKETAGESTIFRYQSLEAGQNFSSIILAENELCFEKIKNLLEDGAIFNFGKSHLAGYGHVKINSIKVSDDWKEYSAVVDEEGNKIVITLLSDTIIRDTNTGAYSTNINSVLGIESKSLKEAFVSTRIRGGFNNTWNLPLPQVLTIRAGSVFVYEKSSELLDRLETLKITGIGEKREEGYGRIAVNWHQVNGIKAEKEDFQESTLPYEIKDPDSLYLAERIVKRMTKEKLDQNLVKAVNRLGINKESIPQKSQLSRMRVIVRRSLNEDDFSIVTGHLKNMKKTASDQFQNAQIEGKSLEQWIKALAVKPQSVWGALQAHQNNLPSLGKIKSDLNDDLAREYTVRLIDSVLHKASKEANNE